MFALNVPNFLTLLRILLVPVLVVALLKESDSGDVIAAGVFAVASITDGIDGYIARSRNAVTSFGKLMDPIADKLLIIASLLALVELGRVAAWVAMVIIAREFAVTALRVAATQEGLVLAAGNFGKLKTLVQSGVIFALILTDSDPLWLDLAVIGMVGVTVASGVDYLFGIRRSINERRAERAAV